MIFTGSRISQKLSASYERVSDQEKHEEDASE